MKTLKLIALGIILLVSSTILAQVSVNVNIGAPPAWAPVGSSQANYYYLPDVQTYYDVRATQFIYFGEGKWIRSKYLPSRYKNYNLYNGYKVVLNDYHGSRPYTHFKNHKVKYYKGYNGRNNRNIKHRNNHSVYVSNRNNENYRKQENRKEYKKYDNDRRKQNHKEDKKDREREHHKD